MAPKIYFMVPFPRNEDYIGKSQIRGFIEAKTEACDGVCFHITIALCGLGGAGCLLFVLQEPVCVEMVAQRNTENTRRTRLCLIAQGQAQYCFGSVAEALQNSTRIAESWQSLFPFPNSTIQISTRMSKSL
jgi:hypothetical protein